MFSVSTKLSQSQNSYFVLPNDHWIISVLSAMLLQLSSYLVILSCLTFHGQNEFMRYEIIPGLDSLVQQIARYAGIRDGRQWGGTILVLFQTEAKLPRTSTNLAVVVQDGLLTSGWYMHSFWKMQLDPLISENTYIQLIFSVLFFHPKWRLWNRSFWINAVELRRSLALYLEKCFFTTKSLVVLKQKAIACRKNSQLLLQNICAAERIISVKLRFNSMAAVNWVFTK